MSVAAALAGLRHSPRVDAMRRSAAFGQCALMSPEVAGSVEPGRQPLPKEITQPLSGSIQNRIYDRYFGYGWSDSMTLPLITTAQEGQNGRRYLDCDIRVRIAAANLPK